MRGRCRHAAALARATEYMRHLGASAAPGELPSFLAEENYQALQASLASQEGPGGELVKRGAPRGRAASDKCKYGFPGCEFCHKRGPGGSLRRGGQPHSAACCAATTAAAIDAAATRRASA